MAQSPQGLSVGDTSSSAVDNGSSSWEWNLANNDDLFSNLRDVLPILDEGPLSRLSDQPCNDDLANGNFDEDIPMADNRCQTGSEHQPNTFSVNELPLEASATSQMNSTYTNVPSKNQLEPPSFSVCSQNVHQAQQVQQLQQLQEHQQRQLQQRQLQQRQQLQQLHWAQQFHWAQQAQQAQQYPNLHGNLPFADSCLSAQTSPLSMSQTGPLTLNSTPSAQQGQQIDHFYANFSSLDPGLNAQSCLHVNSPYRPLDCISVPVPQPNQQNSNFNGTVPSAFDFHTQSAPLSNIQYGSFNPLFSPSSQLPQQYYGSYDDASLEPYQRTPVPLDTYGTENAMRAASVQQSNESIPEVSSDRLFPPNGQHSMSSLQPEVLPGIQSGQQRNCDMIPSGGQFPALSDLVNTGLEGSGLISSIETNDQDPIVSATSVETLTQMSSTGNAIERKNSSSTARLVIPIRKRTMSIVSIGGVDTMKTAESKLKKVATRDRRAGSGKRRKRACRWCHMEKNEASALAIEIL